MLVGGLAATANAGVTRPPLTHQQSKFAVCVHKSKGLKGKAHIAFMLAYLKDDKKDVAKIKAEAKVGHHKKDGNRHTE